MDYDLQLKRHTDYMTESDKGKWQKSKSQNSAESVY